MYSARLRLGKAFRSQRCPSLSMPGSHGEMHLHEGAEDAVDGCVGGRRNVEDGKLALEAVGDVVFAAARNIHRRHKPGSPVALQQQILR